MTILLLLGSPSQAEATVAPDEPIQPWSANSWYWSIDSEPVLLVGGSDDDNLFQWPADELIPQLDRLQAAGGNVIRNTMSDRQDRGTERYPFAQLPNGKYDLRQWNPQYWERFEFMLRETARRDIVVQIEIWDRFDYTDNRGADHWQRHPYNPANNINYTYADSGFSARYDRHPGANNQPFFFTTPQQQNNRVVLPFQEAFVHRLLDHTLEYGHVLYCIDNETQAEPAWGAYWARLIKQRAEAENRTIFVTEMWDAWNLQSDEHKHTFDHPELYDFVDVSQNNHNHGREHWDNFIHVRDYLAPHPRPMNTTKTYGATGNKFGHTDQDAIERFWRHLLAGAASARFHRPSAGLGLNDQVVNSLKTVRAVEEQVAFWDLRAAMSRVRSDDENDAYLVESGDRETLVVFLPGGNPLDIQLPDSLRAPRISWHNIDRAEQIRLPAKPHKGLLNLKPPSAENWIVVIQPQRFSSR